MSPQEELDRSGLVLERRVHRESYQHRTNHPRIQRQALRSNSRSSQVVGAYLEDAQAYRLFLKKLGWTTAEYRANREIKNFLCIKTWREGEGNETHSEDSFSFAFYRLHELAIALLSSSR